MWNAAVRCAIKTVIWSGDLFGCTRIVYTSNSFNHIFDFVFAHRHLISYKNAWQDFLFIACVFLEVMLISFSLSGSLCFSLIYKINKHVCVFSTCFDIRHLITIHAYSAINSFVVRFVFIIFVFKLSQQCIFRDAFWFDHTTYKHIHTLANLSADGSFPFCKEKRESKSSLRVFLLLVNECELIDCKRILKEKRYNKTDLLFLFEILTADAFNASRSWHSLCVLVVLLFRFFHCSLALLTHFYIHRV